MPAPAQRLKDKQIPPRFGRRPIYELTPNAETSGRSRPPRQGASKPALWILRGARPSELPAAKGLLEVAAHGINVALDDLERLEFEGFEVFKTGAGKHQDD